MDITLITEGTYPHHLGGVSVWCDQLLRKITEHRFNVLAISATGAEKNAFAPPSNVVRVETIPLWGHVTRRKAGPVLSKRLRPFQEEFFRSLIVESHSGAFTGCLQMLSRYALAGQLGPAMYTEEAVKMLLSFTPVGSKGRGGQVQGHLSMADAIDVLQLLEHFLRPLAAPPPRSDLCHSTANGLGALPALAAKWTWGTPFLLTEHGVYLRERYLSYKPGSLSQPARAVVLRFFNLLTRSGYEQADIVVPVCRYNRLWEVANGTPLGRIRPVHNGIDPADFPVPRAKPAVPTLVWVGRVDPLKDLETLLRAFARVRAEVPECRLRLFGPVPEGGDGYFSKCVRLSAQLGLDDGAATFEGAIDPPAEAYQAGHVFVFTSISEGFPYVVLEAMASGLPVVATDVGGVAEAVGDTGVLVPPRDSTAVAAACVRLLTRAEERQALGVAARARVLQQFTTDRCFDTYRVLYDELAGRQPDVIQLTQPDRAVRWPASAKGVVVDHELAGRGAVPRRGVPA
jgi:polysaccharide biosynthesis protein PelF